MNSFPTEINQLSQLNKDSGQGSICLQKLKKKIYLPLTARRHAHETSALMKKYTTKHRLQT